MSIAGFRDQLWRTVGGRGQPAPSGEVEEADVVQDTQLFGIGRV